VIDEPLRLEALDEAERGSGSLVASADALRLGDAPWFAGGALLVVISVLIGASIGPAGPSWWRVPLAMLDHLPILSVHSGVSQADWNILWKIRMPRVVLGGLVGGMLSIAGASYQGVFRNPLVDPYLLGAAAGAGLGATLALTMGRGVTSMWAVDPVPPAAFVVAVLTVGVTYAVGRSAGGSRSGTTLVLAGIAVVSFATALQTFILQRHNDVIRKVFSWVLGRLSGATWADVALIVPYVALSSFVLLLHRRQLDVFRVGDVEAATLGMSVSRSRLVIVIAATLGTAAVVSVSGLIGFVGLVIPHVIRLVAGGSYRRLLPLSLMVGASFLILADVPGRMLTNPAETPIGVTTAFIGAPFFIYLLRTKRVTI
jgi:iron complex transport system permease protein